MTQAANTVTIRNIEPQDNEPLAKIIRSALEEFGANKPGTVYFDPTTDALYQLFQTPRSQYFVAENEKGLLGGGGIYPTDGLPADTCELVKMYLRPEARGLGLGRQLIEQCMEAARAAGFSKMYLETMPELRNALVAYEKLGFKYLDRPIGNSGHFGCGLWMLVQL
ncbi:GNAT family N-acetyltransferase [Paracnuella aquatica]|uniref:GNAT family N-acetyltransferase n=1 Tax=Paracnuella aquatica TaxID=2268757 RepID=UPI000DEF7331|nr:GNAT family N-acetyltransferase [Paracnuella aquatica]RPD44748.1 GNAT family N-acetyltransferase [Paracnuella aquatica]